jgi:hypothetical protein
MRRVALNIVTVAVAGPAEQSAAKTETKRVCMAEMGINLPATVSERSAGGYHIFAARRRTGALQLPYSQATRRIDPGGPQVDFDKSKDD